MPLQWPFFGQRILCTSVLKSRAADQPVVLDSSLGNGCRKTLGILSSRWGPPAPPSIVPCSGTESSHHTRLGRPAAVER